MVRHKRQPGPIDRAALREACIAQCGGDVLAGLCLLGGLLDLPPTLGRPWLELVPAMIERDRIEAAFRALADAREGG